MNYFRATNLLIKKMNLVITEMTPSIKTRIRGQISLWNQIENVDARINIANITSYPKSGFH